MSMNFCRRRILQDFSRDCIRHPIGIITSQSNGSDRHFDGYADPRWEYQHDPQLKFLIKHNFRREDRYAIAEELESVCQNVQHPRDGKVYISAVHGVILRRKRKVNLPFVWPVKSPNEQHPQTDRKCCSWKQKQYVLDITRRI